jgi:hypothetical protein
MSKRSFIITISNLFSKKKLTQFFLFILPLPLFLTRPVNLNPLLGTTKSGNNFVDLVISPADFLSILLALIVLVLIIYQIWLQLKSKRLSKKNPILLGFLGFFCFGFWLWQVNLKINLTSFSFPQTLTQIYFWLKTNSTLILWLISIILAIKCLPKIVSQKNIKILILFLPILISSFFDHFLITSTTPILLFLSLLGLLGEVNINQNGLPQKFQNLSFTILLGWYGLNLVVALWQVLNGNSLGLSLLGEPILDLEMQGIAKQPIMTEIARFIGIFLPIQSNLDELQNLTILRGYGLTQHPNILGFSGVLGSAFSLCQSFLQNLTSINKIKKWLLRSLFWLGIGLVLVSFSRSAIVSLLLVLGFNWIFNCKLKFKFNKFTKIILASSTALITTFFVSFLGNPISNSFFSSSRSDFYRFDDLQNWLNLINTLPIQNLFFGIGPGQYAFNLAQSLPNQASWSWVPVHNTFLLLIAEFGVINLILVVVFLVLFTKKYKV